jgi:hypothetical protein
MWVQWYREQFQCPVLWVNPYATRLPELKDLNRRGRTRDYCATEIPEWLQVLTPKSLPIEPLPGFQWLNGSLWRPLLAQLSKFAAKGHTLLAFGKPSALALRALEHLPECASFYDAMDDFPQFYRGLSRRALCQREQQLVQQVELMAVSSRALQHKWCARHAHIQLVPNALKPALFGEPARRTRPGVRPVLGYLGTLAQWFDWPWVIALAQAFPEAEIRLVGPCFSAPPPSLPANISLLPGCEHGAAIAAMQDFDLGLIPFKRNSLTESVDPIKYYEYRALGLPVLATAFGEMKQHQREPGTFLSHSLSDIGAQLALALAHRDTEAARQEFIRQHSWSERFAPLLAPLRRLI